MSGLSALPFGGFGRGKKTASAGTKIRVLVPGKRGCFTYLTFLRYTAGATAHTLTVMRKGSASTAAGALAASGTALIVAAALTDAAGNAIAANDVVAVECTDGTWFLDIVSGWNSGTLTITLTSGVPAGKAVAVGNKVVSYGVAGDSGHADYQLAAPDAATTNYPAVANAGPLARSVEMNEPLIIDSDNASNAGVVENLCAVYSDK